MQTNTHYYVAALYFPQIGTRTLQHLISTFGDIQTIFTAKAEDLAAFGCTPQQIHAIQHPEWEAVERALRWAETESNHLLLLEHPAYPTQLKEISDPPHILFVAGNLKALTTPQIAIVGARHASPIGLQNAERFAYHLAECGFTITSGLALGIDGASHRGALNAKGITIGVTGTGLNKFYPPSHYALTLELLAKNGAVMSEFPLDMPPIPQNFPRRNRLISGLSLGVLVVEAALKSGSMITVKFALEQGREVFAIPGSIHHPLAKGCHTLIRQGAKLVETAQDIVEELNNYLQVSPPTSKKTQKPPIPPDLMPTLALIGYEMTPLDMILCRSGLTLSQVSSILLKLELDGYIQSMIGGYIRLAK